jgi:hypothetical protein
MKLDLRGILIGLAVIAALAALALRENRRPACAGGVCCFQPPVLDQLQSNARAGATEAAEFAGTNQSAHTPRARQ